MYAYSQGVRVTFGGRARRIGSAGPPPARPFDGAQDERPLPKDGFTPRRIFDRLSAAGMTERTLSLGFIAGTRDDGGVRGVLPLQNLERKTLNHRVSQQLPAHLPNLRLSRLPRLLVHPDLNILPRPHLTRRRKSQRMKSPQDCESLGVVHGRFQRYVDFR